MSFLTYTLSIPTQYLWTGLLKTYVGNFDYTGDDSWGKYLTLEYDMSVTNKEQLASIRANKNTVHEYNPEDGVIIFVLKIPPKYKKNVVDPFLEGAYSKIDRAYVNAHFSARRANGSYSTNWLILTKDNSLRKFWEDQIGLPLPHNAEVWSRPLKEDEIYNYESYLVAQELISIETPLAA